MANIKFSQFTVETAKADVDFLVGYSGPDNVQISPTNLLSDYPTFTGAVGQVAFFDSTSSIGGDNDLYWDDTNKRLGIGLTNPSSYLEIKGGATLSAIGFSGPTVKIGDYSGIGNTRIFSNGSYISYSTSSSYHDFNNTGASQMRITTSGDVGIGTTTPSAKLDVQGTLIATGISQLGSSGSNVYLTSSSAGNVGIGTSSPATKLHIAGTATPTIRIEDTTNNRHLQLFHDNDNSYIRSSTGSQIRFQTNGANDRMLIDTIGNVGIGTSSPNRKLHVVSSEFVVADFARPSGGNAYLSMEDATTTGSGYVGVGANGNDLTLRSGNVERARLTSSGNFGIGTTSPSHNLQVESTGNAEIQTQRTSGAGVLIQSQASAGTVGTNTNHRLDLKTNSTTRMTVATSGNVGIGTTSPGVKLDVDGTIRVSQPYKFELANGQYIKDDGSAGLDIATINSIAGITFITNSFDRMKITSSGNVGIGTITPAAKLDVVGRIGLNDGNNNVSVGDNAGAAITTGTQNIIVGGLAGDALTTGALNVAIGHGALGAEDTGSGNVAVGYKALNDLNYDGSGYNIGVGYLAGEKITTGTLNVLIGGLAGDALTTGTNNVAIGYAALSTEDANGKNIAIGASALLSLNAGADAYNIAIGDQAGKSVTTGTQNTIVGGLAGDALTTGGNNTAVGYSALGSEDAHGNNTAIGVQTLLNLNAGTDGNNTAVGHQAGLSMSTGTLNTLIGSLAGDALTTGGGNVVLGYQALTTEQAGGRNVAIGNFALQDLNTGSNAYNVAVGHAAGANVTTGIRNTIIGGLAGDAITTANYNVAIGYGALSSEDTLSGNTAVGYNTLTAANGGSFNVALGYEAGDSMTTGDNNTLLGTQAGDSLTTGSNNIVVGYAAAASAVGVDNEITLGNSSISTLRCQVTTITSLSDKRDKENIQPSNYGLDLINKLKPVTFDWNMRDGGKVGIKDLGFIAQDLQEVDDENLKLVYDSNPEKLEASYGRLVPVLVKAIQELKQEIEQLKNKH